MRNFPTRTLLDAVVATGAGESFWLPKVIKDHIVEIYFVDANTSVTAVTVCIQQSFEPETVNDADARWYTMQEIEFTTEELTAKQGVFAILNMPAIRIRANLTVFTSSDGTNDKLTVRHKASGGR